MISLVMTTYNGLKYISEQLESIKNQTVLPDEVLIYDDRSTDGTYEYVQEYIQTNKLDKWNVVRNKENKGYSLNFSDAMKESHGDIVFLCDQDDIWHLDKIKVMSEIMNSHPEIELLASNVHEKRKDCLINTKLISSVMMVRYLRYYGQTRFWMTDLYYVLKNKHK